MAVHLVGFYESVDAAAAYNTLNALTDETLTATTVNLQVPDTYNKIIAIAAGVGSGGNGIVRLEAPSLRGHTLYMVVPVNGRNDGNVEPGSPHVVVDKRSGPLQLKTAEQLNAAVHSDTTLAAVQWCFVWLADTVPAPVSGDIRTIRATNTSTLTAGAWTNGALTMDEALPVGNYDVVGMRAQSAGLLAARMLFKNQFHRPGVLGTDAQEDLEHPMFRFGQLGVFGTFHTTNLPSVDFLSLSGDSSQVVFLDVIGPK